MHHAGERTLGQLISEKYRDECRLIGFSTYTGTVTGASNWDGPAERNEVRASRSDSFEGVFHKTGFPAFVLPLEHGSQVSYSLSEPMLEQAIGVVYLPESDLSSHYFKTRLSDQFDAILHCDRTRAVEPLEPVAELKVGEPAETFPSGM